MRGVWGGTPRHRVPGNGRKRICSEGSGGMVRPEGVEPPTYWFVASCSIQLSYGRTLQGSNSLTI